MNTNEIRSRFLKFFEKRNHVIIESASLVTSDEKGVTNSTLFNTAGMQPLIPYLLGKPHSMGKRLADVQKCVRTIDIDDVGDKTHATFFEMLGNWSLGDYGKKEAINWSYEFLTSKEEGLGLDPKRLYVTVFKGDEVAPKDEEAAEIWMEVFHKNDVNVTGFPRHEDFKDMDYLDIEPVLTSRIFFMGKESNWWQAGENGPCGPDTEMYYDVQDTFGGKTLTTDQFIEADKNRQLVEVWNDVFMQYEKKEGKIVGKLPMFSIDTGAGLERLALSLSKVDNIYDIDINKDVLDYIKSISKIDNLSSQRIVLDHIKASVFLIADGVIPHNTGRGYVLRKLIRRAVRHMDKIGSNVGLINISEKIIGKYEDAYTYLKNDRVLKSIKSILQDEENRFRETLKQGMKEFERLSSDKTISGSDAFMLFSSYGFPLELIKELAKEKGVNVDESDFEIEFKKHQDLSRQGAEQKFKGGLANTSDMSVRYHTATHLLHQALHDVYGDSVMQKGSNINDDRLRFDYSHGEKMTADEKKKIEDIINEKINEALPINQVTLSKVQAEKTGARHFFAEKYGDEISVYFIGKDIDDAYSKEYCGGPHVKNTKELSGPDGAWKFHIEKEEALGQGIRRIKAVLK